MARKGNYLEKYLIISIILSLIYIIISVILIHDDIKFLLPFLLLCIVPYICTSFSFIIGNFTQKKHPKITKITVNIINLTVLILHFCFISIMFMIFWAFSDISDEEYTDVKDYQKALNSYTFEVIQHFPREIPEDAKNVSMRKSASGFTGDSDFYLKFDIDKDFIQAEMNRLPNNNKVYNNSYDRDRADSVFRTIIQNTDNWNIITIESSSCYRGIATKENTILYILYCD